jgi:hypothetical protein
MDHGIRNPVLRTLVYGHVWLALGAAAQTAWMQELLGLEGWRAPVLAFCGTMAGYTFMRWARMDHPDATSAPHLVWFRAHRRPLLYAALFCFGCGSAIALPSVHGLFRMLWPAAVVTLFYVVPPGLVGGRTIGLRWLPLFKALLIAATWSLVTVGLPLAIGGSDLFADPAAWLFVLQFTFFLALAIAFDLRDNAVDPPSLRTVPRLVGIKVSKVVALLLLLHPITVFLLLAFLSRAMDEPGIPSSFASEQLCAATGYIATGLLVLRSGPGHGAFNHDLVLDGMLVLVPLLWWLGTLI